MADFHRTGRFEINSVFREVPRAFLLIPEWCKEAAYRYEGLNISDNKKLCQKWMNQFPTLFFSFKDVDGLTFSSAYDMLTMKLADLFRQHQYLLESNAVDDGDKAAFT